MAFFVKIILCAVSMLLTALFAVSFAKSSNIPFFDLGSVDQLSIVIMVLVGLSLDMSKYLFWSDNSLKFLSVTLLIFSWVASVAFFISNENGVLEVKRVTSFEYQAYEEEVDSLREEIKRKISMVEKRFSSKFHEQWDMGESMSGEIDQASSKLKILLQEEPNIGRVKAQNDSSTYAFFRSISSIAGSSPETVRTFFYGILALLIEVCSLGMITHNNNLKRAQLNSLTQVGAVLDDNIVEVNDELEGIEPIKVEDIRKKDNHTESLEMKEKTLAIEERMDILKKDILEEVIPPVISKIKQANYSLTDKYIREVINEFRALNIIVDAPRKSFQLNKVVAREFNLKAVDHA